jgi:hypothetical protein
MEEQNWMTNMATDKAVCKPVRRSDYRKEDKQDFMIVYYPVEVNIYMTNNKSEFIVIWKSALAKNSMLHIK